MPITAMTGLVRVLLSGLLAACAAGAVVHSQQHTEPAVVPATGAPDSRKGRSPLDARLDRQRGATERALFASDDPLAITLIADFRAVNRDRNPDSTRTFPGTLVATGPGGRQDRIPVKIRTRGHARRMTSTCSFAPIRIEFSNKTEGTVFEGHKSIKLGTHCRDLDSYEQYVYREYLVYKLFNQVTGRSFRARLADATYVDTTTNRPLASRAGLFLEDDDDVARRLGGQTTALEGLTFAHVDSEAMSLLGLFEFMIGNTDMSLFKLHNIVLVREVTGKVYPIPYDFDYSGLVNARYAIPAAGFNLPTVRDRLYRGPCLTADELAPLLTRIQGMHAAVMSLYDSIPKLDPGYRRDARGYLDQFFKLIQKPGDVKRAFIDGCDKRTTM